MPSGEKRVICSESSLSLLLYFVNIKSSKIPPVKLIDPIKEDVLIFTLLDLEIISFLDLIVVIEVLWLSSIELEGSIISWLASLFIGLSTSACWGNKSWKIIS